MKAEIISIGTELLLGHIINTNTSYISKKMANLGIDVHYHSTVGDNEERLSKLLKTVLRRSDIVFTTGGLGPTVDDIMVSTVSKTIGRRLVFNKQIAKEIKKYFKKQHLPFPKDSLKQAYIPEGCVWLKNNVGTAPGLIIPLNKKIIICLPGPPREVNPILEKDVIPYLKRYTKTRQCIKSHSIKLVGLPEAAVNKKVKDLLRLSGTTTVGIYAHLGEVHLKITTKAKDEKACKNNISRIEAKIRKRFVPYLYGVDDETLEGVVARLLLKRKKTIGIAESCTGGLISNRITNIPGSSKYFKMGITAYSDEVKTCQLGVSRKLLNRYGAVSSAIALSMARGIRKRAHVDIGIGVTGIAGPGGATKTKPVGLVYMALVTDKEHISKKFFFLGKREEIKFLASQAALNLIRTHLLNTLSPKERVRVRGN